MPTFLDASGRSTLLQKIKTVFATKTELNALENDLVSRANALGTTFVHKTGNETIEGTKTFSNSIVGNVTGNLTGNVLGDVIGGLTGDVTGNCSGSSGSCTGNAATATLANAVKAFPHTIMPADNLATDGLQVYGVYNDTGYPFNYGNVINVQGSEFRGAGQLMLGWSGNTNGIASIYYRNKRDNQTTWSDWRTLAFADTDDSGYLRKSGGAMTGSIRCTAKYTSADTTYTSDLLTFNSGNNSYGNNVALGGGGNTIIGGGESYSAQLSALAGNGAEACYVCADNAIYLKSNCNTFANAKTTTIGTDGKVACPQGFVGTISSSSDMRLKKDVESISSKMLDAWDGIEWVQFKFKADDSKMHFGIIAQDLNRQLSNSGIEASSCTISESNPNYDPATMDELPEALTVNYIEALVIEAAYQRRRADRLEERLSALERKVESLKS